MPAGLRLLVPRRRAGHGRRPGRDVAPLRGEPGACPVLLSGGRGRRAGLRRCAVPAAARPAHAALVPGRHRGAGSQRAVPSGRRPAFRRRADRHGGGMAAVPAAGAHLPGRNGLGRREAVRADRPLPGLVRGRRGAGRPARRVPAGRRHRARADRGPARDQAVAPSVRPVHAGRRAGRDRDPGPVPVGRSAGYGSRTTARARVRTLASPERAVSASTTRLPSSFSSIWPLISTVAPASSSGTTTIEENRTPNSTSSARWPAQSVTYRPACAIVNMPCAITFGSPTDLAIRSFQWMTLKSPDAPQYLTRLSRLTG